MSPEQLESLAKLDRSYPSEQYSRRVTSGPAAGSFWVEYTRYGRDAADARCIIYASGEVGTVPLRRAKRGAWYE